MKRSKMLGVLLMVLLIAAFAACEQEGPAEQAGEKIDQAVDEAGDKMEKAGETIQEKTEEMKDKAQEAVQ
jgi:hypothetical protein